MSGSAGKKKERVSEGGIEPPPLAGPEPKSGASASSATRPLLEPYRFNSPTAIDPSAFQGSKTCQNCAPELISGKFRRILQSEPSTADVIPIREPPKGMEDDVERRSAPESGNPPVGG